MQQNGRLWVYFRSRKASTDAKSSWAELIKQEVDVARRWETIKEVRGGGGEEEEEEAGQELFCAVPRPEQTSSGCL